MDFTLVLIFAPLLLAAVLPFLAQWSGRLHVLHADHGTRLIGALALGTAAVALSGPGVTTLPLIIGSGLTATGVTHYLAARSSGQQSWFSRRLPSARVPSEQRTGEQRSTKPHRSLGTPVAAARSKRKRHR